MAQKESEKALQKSVKKVADTLRNDVPEIVKNNKGAALGVVAGYFLGEFLKDKENVVTAVLGGLVGHVVDEKKKKDVF